MGKTIKIGGVGKNPVIEKINQINQLSDRIEAASKIEQAVFAPEDEQIRDRLNQRRQIIHDFSISFKNKN